MNRPYVFSITLPNRKSTRLTLINFLKNLYTVQPAYMERFGPHLYPEEPYKRDSAIPLPIHTQESGPGDPTLYADIPCI